VLDGINRAYSASGTESLTITVPYALCEVCLLVSWGVRMVCGGSVAM